MSTTSCYFFSYISYYDLAVWTQVSHTMFGVYIEPEIEIKNYNIILERDSYGRWLFAIQCWDRVHYNDGRSLIYVGIVQKFGENHVYYYPGEQKYLLVEDLNAINNVELSQLKENNDWEKELSLNQCVEKKVTLSFKKGGYGKRSVLKRVTRQIDIEYESYSVYYLDTDINGLELYAVELTYWDDNKIINYAVYAIIIASSGKNDYSVQQIKHSDYREELLAFKLANDWQYDYYVEG